MDPTTIFSFDISAILDKVKDVLMVGQVIDKLQGYWEKFNGAFNIMDKYAEYKSYILIVAICLLALIGFEGYKLFKMALRVLIPAGMACAGYLWIAPYVVEHYPAIPGYEFIDIKALVAVVLALVGLLLVSVAYNFTVMIIGGACGYGFGYLYAWKVICNFFDSLEFLQKEMVGYIIGGVCAAVCILVFILIFKHMVIIGTSLGGLALAGVLLQKLAVPAADNQMKLCFALVGVAAGIIAAARQYKEDEKSFEFLF